MDYKSRIQDALNTLNMLKDSVRSGKDGVIIDPVFFELPAECEHIHTIEQLERVISLLELKVRDTKQENHG